MLIYEGPDGSTFLPYSSVFFLMFPDKHSRTFRLEVREGITHSLTRRITSLECLAALEAVGASQTTAGRTLRTKLELHLVGEEASHA